MALAPAPDTIKALRLETSKIPVNLCHWAKFFGYAPTAYLFVREGYIPFRPPNQLQPSGEVFWPETKISAHQRQSLGGETP